MCEIHGYGLRWKDYANEVVKKLNISFFAINKIKGMLALNSVVCYDLQSYCLQFLDLGEFCRYLENFYCLETYNTYNS